MEAIKNSYLSDFSSLEVFREAEIRESDPEAQALLSLKKSDGWAIIRDLIDRTLQELDQMLLIKMSNGSDLKDIGQLAVTNQLIKDVLNRIKSRVQDTPDE